MTAIGFIGTGALGRPIAAKLMAAGRQLLVFDSDTRATAPLAKDGARVAASARAVAEEAAIVFACLPAPKVSRSVAAEVIGGKALEIYVELSTLGTATIEAIGAMLAVRGKLLLDTPIVGGAGGSGVAAGNIAVISAGPKEAFARVRPLLDALTDRIFYVGATPGQAQICKMVNNAIGITGLTIACEAMVMGVKAGIDPKLLLDIVNAGSGRNVATAEKFPRAILPRNFSDVGTIDIGLKDMALYVEALHQLGLPSMVGSTIMEIWQSAKAEDPARSYHSLIKFFERFAGIEVKG